MRLTLAQPEATVLIPLQNRRGLTISANVVWLDINALDLATLDDECVALAAVCAEEWRRGKLDVQGTGEGAAGVGQETDTATLFSVEGLAPGIGSVWWDGR